jgi:hypothetical protein
MIGRQEIGAADLSKIDRTIRKEPVYRNKGQGYCLLVFGPVVDFALCRTTNWCDRAFPP